MLIHGLLKKIVGIVISVLAFVACLSFVLLAINSIFVLVTDETAILVMTLITRYAGISLILLVALKSALGFPFFIRIPYIILIALVLLLNFFPAVYESLIAVFLPPSA
jgi:hypothetical protein